MSVRKKCERDGHKWRDITGTMSLPYVYCGRFFCDAQAVAAWAPPSLAAHLHNAIPKEDRFPKDIA